MLGKLMKYEVKSTARVFLPLYGALVLMAVITKLTFVFGSSSLYDRIASNRVLEQLAGLPMIMATVLYGMMIVAIFVMTVVVMIQRFYKNLLGDEGYLMFTLPVEPWKNIVNKLLISMMWIILSGIVTLFTIFILAFDSRLFSEFFTELRIYWPMFIQEWREEVGVSMTAFLLEMGVASFISTIDGILHVYASISIGQLANKNKLLAAFGAFIGINIVKQIIGGVASVVILLMFSGDIANSSRMPDLYMHASMLTSIMITVLTAVACYITTHVILTKKLNLE